MPFATRTIIALFALLAPVAALSAQSDSTARPKVLVIATGGTIAGVQQEPGGIGAYRAGALTAEQIIASVPPLSRYAQVEAEQFSNVASTMISPDQWVALARRINAVLAERADIAGVVVTHGTDRLEETAFFLYLTVRSEKPVVVVGAQRPATGLSPDGPVNLLAAVRTVVSPQAVGKGVLVVMDDRIISAREVRKQYQRVGGFDGGEMGMLGIVGGNSVEFFFAPTRRHGPASEFDLAGVTALPTVDLVFSYPGGAGRTYATNPAGIVISSTGFTCAETAAYQELMRAGVVLVSAFPSGDNINGGGNIGNAPRSDSLPNSMRESCPDLVRSGVLRGPIRSTLAAQHLTPQKARILLMLALTRTSEPREIQRYFNTY
jgi:L-asparaginase type II